MPIKPYAQEMIDRDPVFRDIAELKETVWINDKYLPFEMVDAVCQLVVDDEDIADADARLRKFASYIRKCFPETEADGGLIESPLEDISNMQAALKDKCGADIPGRLLLKMDSHLPIAGSVKARGGIYEVLKHAEDLALAEGMITEDDDYARFADDDMKEFFGRYTVQVGSTGNLGLSIGIMSAFLGFKVKVHMSADAKQWKKDMLRSKGVDVIEYEDDYSKAVAEGRRLSDMDPMSYFVDDEYSIPLFLGYAVAAGRMVKQLEEKGITVDSDHPMIVYVPCGVGGAPDLSDMLSDEDYAEAKKNGYFTMEYDFRDPSEVSLQWCEDVKNTDVLKVFSAFEGPVCAIYGTEDKDVDPVWSKRICETNQNKASVLYPIEGMDHTFNVFSEDDRHSLKDAVHETGTFLAATLGASGTDSSASGAAEPLA